jgi:hypothetical protein
MARRDAARVWARVVAAAVGAGLLMAAACGPGESPDAGPDDPGTASDAGTSTAPQSAPGVLDASITTVGSSLRIAWTVTNASGADLVVFDDRRPDEAAGTERYGAFVTAGHDDATVEVARRLFPVPDDLEGVRAYGVNANPLPAGASAEGREIVKLPLAYAPAAPEGGGDPLPADPARVVFCVGVAPAADFPPTPPDDYRFAVHNAGNVSRQSLLCSDPFDLPAG